MKTTADRKELEQAAEEIFELTKMSWIVRNRQNRSKGQYELTEFEFLTLDALVKSEPDMLTVGDLQRRIRVLPAQMSRVIRSLETKAAKPLIRCQINPTDKRKVDVILTDNGRKAHAAFREERLAASIDLVARLTQNDRLEFMRILSEMRHIIANQLTVSELTQDSEKDEKMISSS